MRMCGIEGCNEKHRAKGYCKRHYDKLMKYGDPLYGDSQEDNRTIRTKTKIFKDIDKFKIIDGIDHKICNNCEKFFPMNDDYFYIIGNGKFHSYCKMCASKRASNWLNSNKDRRKASYTKYNNKEDVKLKMRIAAKEQREKGDQKAWRQENKDKIKEYGTYRRMNKTHEFTEEEWKSCKDYFDNSCAYCGISEKEAKEQQGQYLHKEHVIHDGSNGLDNCVPACKSCNSKKWTHNFEEWYKSNENYTEERYSKINKWLIGDSKFCVKLNNIMILKGSAMK